jgi:prepilin-type N-terminal cleavage/methylation domain-containing protein
VTPNPSTPDRNDRAEQPRASCEAASCAGFSLPEVLVAMLIVGVLAAVAIASLLSTADTANDAQAKELVRNAQTAAETFALDHQSSYAGISATELASVEPNLETTASTQHAYLSEARAADEGQEYTLTAIAADGDELTITREADGTVTRGCYSPKLKSGCGGVERSSW